MRSVYRWETHWLRLRVRLRARIRARAIAAMTCLGTSHLVIIGTGVGGNFGDDQFRGERQIQTDGHIHGALYSALGKGNDVHLWLSPLMHM